MRSLVSCINEAGKNIDINTVTIDDIYKDCSTNEFKRFVTWLIGRPWVKQNTDEFIATASSNRIDNELTTIRNTIFDCNKNSEGSIRHEFTSHGEVYYIYCPLDDKHYTEVTLDFTGDNIIFSYKITNKYPKKLGRKMGPWPAAFNSYIINNILKSI